MSAAKSGGPCLVLDCDEDDASAYRRLARLYRNWGHGRHADWAEAEADAFKTLAAHWLPRFDLRLAASVGEARLLSGHAKVSRWQSFQTSSRLSASRLHLVARKEVCRDIVFVGTLGYLPNIDAALWFAKRIWPRLRAAVPFPLRFVIAGQGAPRAVMELARQPGIVVLGGFDDAAAALPPRRACRGADSGGWRHADQAARKRKIRRAGRGHPVWRSGYRVPFGTRTSIG